ncbi:hypothetical protein ACER0C_022286 [Sarotherodon galilaeus]
MRRKVRHQMGKNMEKNIVALITHSDGRRPENALKAFEKSKSWDLTKKQIFDFVTFVESCGRQSLMKTKKVLKKCIECKACIQNLQERIKLTELKQRETGQIQEVLKKHEETTRKNKKFTVEVDEIYKEKENIKGGMWGGALCCRVCEENCHYPGCTVSWCPSHCEVMKDGRCTVCTNEYPASAHVKEMWIYVTKTRKVQKTREEMKQHMRQIKMKIRTSQLLNESYKPVVKPDELALKANSASTIVHLDFLIEKMKEKGDRESPETGGDEKEKE